jgi:hypothetical protein
MASETTLVPGEPEEWKEFENADYDPAAEAGSDEDLLGALIAELPEADPPFGIMVVCEPFEVPHPSLVKRLAATRIPSKVHYEARGGGKVGEGKKKKSK